MKFNNFFKIVLALTLICQVNAAFSMKRKREVEIQSYENKDMGNRFNCPYSGLECSAKKWGRVNKRICNNNDKNGYVNKQTLSNHILNFHRACPLCPENQQTINTPVLELVQHIKNNHLDNQSEVLYCTNCNDYIVLSSNSHSYREHIKRCQNNNNNNVFYNNFIPEVLNFHHQPFNQPPGTTTSMQPQQNISIIQNIFNFNTFPQPQLQTNLYAASMQSMPSSHRFETMLCPVYQPNPDELAGYSEPFVPQNFSHELEINSYNNIETSHLGQNELLQQILPNDFFIHDTELPNISDDMSNFQELLNNNNNNTDIQDTQNNEPCRSNKIIHTSKTVGLNSKQIPCPYAKDDNGFYNCPYCLKSQSLKTTKALFVHILQKHRICPFCSTGDESGTTVRGLIEHCLAIHNINIESNCCAKCMDYIADNLNLHKKMCQ